MAWSRLRARAPDQLSRVGGTADRQTTAFPSAGSREILSRDSSGGEAKVIPERGVTSKTPERHPDP